MGNDEIFTEEPNNSLIPVKFALVKFSDKDKNGNKSFTYINRKDHPDQERHDHPGKSWRLPGTRFQFIFACPKWQHPLEG